MATMHQGYQYAATGRVINCGSYTENTAGDSVKTVGCDKITFEITALGIAFNFNIRLEGTLDDVTWFPIADPISIVAAGQYILTYDRCASLLAVRPWITEVLSGTPTVTAQAKVERAA